jgi:hypothetical protein
VIIPCFHLYPRIIKKNIGTGSGNRQNRRETTLFLESVKGDRRGVGQPNSESGQAHHATLLLGYRRSCWMKRSRNTLFRKAYRREREREVGHPGEDLGQAHHNTSIQS